MNQFESSMFLENIEWFDDTGKELIHRLPEQGSGAIKFGAQLTVRESQAAVLFYQGKACDCFTPGRHTLKTANLPLLTKILSFPWRGESPLRAEIYMVNLKLFPDLKWGTQNPVAFRDKELGLIRIRANGVFTIQIVQPVLFIHSLVGTMGKMDTDSIASYLKMIIVSRFNDYLGKTLRSILDLPGKFDDLAEQLSARLTEDFASYGLHLKNLYITSITPPDEVQSAIDDVSRINAIKDMNKLLKLKMAMALEKAATASNATGTALGFGAGMLLPAMFQTDKNTASNLNSKEKDAIGTLECTECLNEIPADSRFCPRCGHQLLRLASCAHCGASLTPQAKFCSQCGKSVEEKAKTKTCPSCHAENLSNSIYCNECGIKLD